METGRLPDLCLLTCQVNGGVDSPAAQLPRLADHALQKEAPRRAVTYTCMTRIHPRRTSDISTAPGYEGHGSFDCH